MIKTVLGTFVLFCGILAFIYAFKNGTSVGTLGIGSALCIAGVLLARWGINE